MAARGSGVASLVPGDTFSLIKGNSSIVRYSSSELLQINNALFTTLSPKLRAALGRL